MMMDIGQIAFRPTCAPGEGWDGAVRVSEYTVGVRVRVRVRGRVRG